MYNKHRDNSYQTQRNLTVHNVHVSAWMFISITLHCKLEEQPFFSTFLPDCLGHQEAYRCVAQILRLSEMMDQI